MNRVLPGSELVFALGDIARLWRQLLERELGEADLGLTAAEIRTLTYVVRFEGLRQSELAGLMDLEPMTLSGFLDRLAARGLIERIVEPEDRRARRIHPTAAAIQLLARACPCAQGIYNGAVSGLDSEQVGALERALHLVKTNIAGLLRDCGEGRREASSA